MSKTERNKYFISNLKSGSVCIIDEYTSSIKSMNVGCRPFTVKSNENNIFIASDNSNNITIINHLDEIIEVLSIPNNGIIEVECNGSKIYISDSCEIIVYDIYLKEKIATIQGFMAIESMKLSNDNKKLYVLDIFLNELKVYDTSDFNLIFHIKNIGVRPNCIAISEDENLVCIGNEGNKTSLKPGNISIVDIYNNKVNKISLPINSSITGLALNKDILYAVNRGLNRIEIIKLCINYVINYIPTTKSEPQKIFLTPDKTKLIVSLRNSEGQGGVDIIDVNENRVIRTFEMESNNTQPYDVIAINYSCNDKCNDDYSEFECSNLDYSNQDSGNNDKGYFSKVQSCERDYFKKHVLQNEKVDCIEKIIGKKVFSSHENMVGFPKIIVDIKEKNNNYMKFEKIRFHKGVIINSIDRIPIKEKMNFYKFNYKVKIPYIIHYKNKKEEINCLSNYLEFINDGEIHIPEDNDDFDIEIDTICKLSNEPLYIKDKITFAVEVCIKTKIVKEIELLVPCYKTVSLLDEHELDEA